MKPAIFEEVENQLIDALADGALEGVNVGDVHHVVYNQSETYVYTQDAERDLEQIGTFLAVRTVMEYEQTNLGQTAPALQYGDPCWVANMVVYILGEELVCQVFDPDNNGFPSDVAITPDSAKRYAEMLDKALAEEPDLIVHLWNRL
jgi:hypothetical protein